MASSKMGVRRGGSQDEKVLRGGEEGRGLGEKQVFRRKHGPWRGRLSGKGMGGRCRGRCRG